MVERGTSGVRMLSFLLCLATTDCPAAEPTVTDADKAEAAQDQVQEVRAEVLRQSSQLLAIEHYLADKQRAADGHAPKGWVQPALYQYADIDAPDSFIPLPPPPVVTVVTRVPVETTLSSQGPTQ